MYCAACALVIKAGSTTDPKSRNREPTKTAKDLAAVRLDRSTEGITEMVYFCVLLIVLRLMIAARRSFLDLILAVSASMAALISA